MSEARQFSPAAERNRKPILEVLSRVLPSVAKVLEIASGSGEHAVFFAQHEPLWDFQPSDPDPSARESIAAWTLYEGVANVRPPLDIDVRAAEWGQSSSVYDALLSCNMIHIAPWESTLGLVAGASRLLRRDGLLVLYGPFKRNGRHTAPSNEAFDASLKARDPTWGVRDLGDVEREAKAKGFELREIVEMPANNLTLVFAKT
jgi:hypothetical protein